MTTFVERYRNEGRQEGKQEGRQEGMQKGEAKLLLRQLNSKFGEIPKDKRRMIESADPDTLLKWSERVLTANSLDEVFK